MAAVLLIVEKYHSQFQAVEEALLRVVAGELKLVDSFRKLKRNE